MPIDKLTPFLSSRLTSNAFFLVHQMLFLGKPKFTVCVSNIYAILLALLPVANIIINTY